MVAFVIIVAAIVMKDEEGGSNQAGTQDYQPYPRMSAEESSQQYTKSWTPFSQYFWGF